MNLRTLPTPRGKIDIYRPMLNPVGSPVYKHYYNGIPHKDIEIVWTFYNSNYLVIKQKSNLTYTWKDRNKMKFKKLHILVVSGVGV